MIVKLDRPTSSAGRPPKGEMRARVLIIEGRFYEEISNELVSRRHRRARGAGRRA